MGKGFAKFAHFKWVPLMLFFGHLLVGAFPGHTSKCHAGRFHQKNHQLNFS